MTNRNGMGPPPIHAQPLQGHISANCKAGKCNYCFTLKCTCPCHETVQ